MEASCIRVQEEKVLRLRGSNSCTVCKKAKAKCDEARPCSRCKRLKRDSACTYDELRLMRVNTLDNEEGLEVEECDDESESTSPSMNVLHSRQGERGGGAEEEATQVWMKPLPHVDPHGWQNMEIEKPLDFWIRSLSFDKPSLLRDHMNSMGWPDRVLARHWEFGFSSQELMNIFVSLPGHCTRSRSSWRTW